MKLRVVFYLLIVLLILLTGCTSQQTGASQQTPYASQQSTDDITPSPESINITRDQAIQIVKDISNNTNDADIRSDKEMDKVIDNVRYYFIQVAYAKKMSAAYFVDASKGNVFVAMDGEFDINNPLPRMETSEEEPASSDESGATEITGSVPDVIQDIFDSIGMTEEQVEQKYGTEHKTVYVSYDGYMKGFLYSDRGFTIAFGNDGKATHVYCTDKIKFNGVKSGMDFSHIQEKLGEATVNQTWGETPIDSAFEIRYRINGRNVVFLSHQEDGSNSIMNIS